MGEEGLGTRVRSRFAGHLISRIASCFTGRLVSHPHGDSPRVSSIACQVFGGGHRNHRRARCHSIPRSRLASRFAGSSCGCSASISPGCSTSLSASTCQGIARRRFRARDVTPASPPGRLRAGADAPRLLAPLVIAVAQEPHSRLRLVPYCPAVITRQGLKPCGSAPVCLPRAYVHAAPHFLCGNPGM